ncbi:MAG: MoaD/ThiS family protein [Planctomycetota bacterium]
MKVTVKLFAGARELAGHSEVKLDLPPSVTIADVRKKLLTEFPQLASLLPHAVFAVDAHYAAEDSILDENSEVACIPPVSGG